jgi:N-acetylglucosaminyl-diphospho-decaprenol L-rhamnosyltransferase
LLEARVAIVNFESGGYLRELLDSIEGATERARKQAACAIQIVVLDNASKDGSAAACDPPRPELTLEPLPRNLGFGAAANRALEDASEEWLVVMNADTLLPADFFLKLREFASAAPASAGIIAPALLNEDGGPQPSVGRFPTLARMLRQSLRDRASRVYLDAHAHRRGPVDWATGACLIFRREAWKRLGGFDPYFFLHYEDVDLCRRAAAMEIGRHFEPALQVVHRNPNAQRAPSPGLLPIIRYSHLRYFHKHRPRAEFHALASMTCAFSLVAQWRGTHGLDRSRGAALRKLAARVARGESSPGPP